MENNGFIKQLVRHFSAVKENTIAFSLYDGSQVVNITYRQFLNDILKATGFFVHKEIKDQHIAIAAANSYDWIVTFFAITGSGNIAVLLNQDLSEDVIAGQCKQADVEMICVDVPLDPAETKDRNMNMKCVRFEEIRTGQPITVSDIFPSNPDDTIVMMFTSGTTGRSKIVEFSSYNMQSSLDDLKESVSSPAMRSFLLTFPLYHISGLITVLSLLRGYRTVDIGRGIKYLLADISKLNPTFVAMVPSTLGSFVKLLKTVKSEGERQKYIGSNLEGICVSGAGVKQSLCRYMMELGIEVQSSYGMTESAGAGTRCVWNEATIGSIGKPFGKTECRIVDGELLLKGPSVMKGYYKDPEETAKIIENGWLHTGDLAFCDEKGFYYLTGRKKNVIILSNGENVNPEEIESQFAECKDILECMVFSDGKGICADVYTEKKPAAADFIKKYNENVPLYRQVYKVTYSAAPLAKTGSGKIKRKENTYV